MKAKYLPIEQDLDGSDTADGRQGVVRKHDMLGAERAIRRERRVVRPHMVSCSRVRDKDSWMRAARDCGGRSNDGLAGGVHRGCRHVRGN